MLRLDHHITLDEKVCHSPNLCEKFGDDDLTRIGNHIWDGYKADEDSRAPWLRRTQSALDLALQLQKEKNFPWPGASNVAFPLVTIAAMDFHSRAYPTLISGTRIVKMRTPAVDPSGELQSRAERVGDFMSFQVLEEDQAWEEQHDRLLLQLPIVGCVFIKTRHDASLGHNVSEVVPASRLVLNYFAKSVETCPRKTHIIELSRNDVYERCVAGTFRDILEEDWYKSPYQSMTPQGSDREDKRIGVNPPMPDEATPITFLEQHCLLDLDGDGYQEPYIVTIEATHRKTVRIVANWESPEDVEKVGSRVLRIRASEYFTKYELIPSPDGGVYGIGFGILLGPLNEAVNSLVNQLVDAGTLSNAAGGFLSRGVKIRGGVYTFSPFEWRRVDSTGDDLKSGIYPLPVREPSQVLFTLLSFLVSYTQRIAGSTDALAGENPGQNTKTGTFQEMVQQGMKIYSAMFKRIWRCMKEEFRKLYLLNGAYLPVSKSFGVSGKISREDFLGDPSQIVPVADPNVVSEQMKINVALAVSERARMIPGYDIPAVEKNLHSAMKLDNTDVLYPGPDKVPPLPNPKMEVEQMKAQIKSQELQQRQQEFVLTLQEEQRINTANIAKLFAQAEAFAAQAQSAESGHQIAMIETMIAAAKQRNEQIQHSIESMLKVMELKNDAEAIDVQREAARNKPVQQ